MYCSRLCCIYDMYKACFHESNHDKVHNVMYLDTGHMCLAMYRIPGSIIYCLYEFTNTFGKRSASVCL